MRLTKFSEWIGVLSAVAFCALVITGWAQTSTTALTTRAVGGVAITTDGVLNNAAIDATGQLRQLRLKAMEQVPADLNKPTPLRMVSLKNLEAAIAKHVQDGNALPDAVKYLAGLQQIQYVLVYPEQHDIVLAGPAEGWKVDAKGYIVGAQSGRPVMLLDDLLVALRTARQAAQGGINCSIDPTSEGLTRLKAYVSKLSTIGDPNTTISNIQQTLGDQKISIQGVPGTTHFARVLVAADYRMKRLAMNFEPAPIQNFPSYMQMVSAKGRGMNNMLPRWWLAPEYQPVLRSPDGLAWELRGGTVKALTEEDYLNSDGSRQHTGKASPLAQKWADNMTARFDELAVAEPVFGQMRNCMELAIIGALIAKENLADKAGFSMPLLMDAGRVELQEFPVPRQVPSQASVLKKGHNWIISASGGVQIHGWLTLQKSETSEKVGAVRTKAAPADANRWWWN
jgi:hypothetical protein